VFDGADTSGFQRLTTDSGFFLIAINNVEPYLDGYKVTFSIGNPFSATYKNLKINVTWGKRLLDALAGKEKDPDAFMNWQHNLHQKELSIPDELLPASWNRVKLVLTPAKSDDLGYISLTLNAGAVILRTPDQ